MNDSLHEINKLFFSLSYLCCTCEAELWDWITSFLKAQVRSPLILMADSGSDSVQQGQMRGSCSECDQKKLKFV